MYIPITGYIPEADPTLPGVITDCDRMVPSLRGYQVAPTPQATEVTAMASACTGSALVRKLDDTTRLFAGTGTKLYEWTGTAWTDRTRVSGGDYSIGYRARFAQQGNVSLASVGKSDALQFSTTGAFADISGAPAANIVVVINQFVMAFDYDDGTDTADGWFCSALGDYTDWTPDIATLCANGRMTSIPGKITAAIRFGDGVIAYKQRGAYLGTFIGSGSIWNFEDLPGDAGALSQEAVISVGTADNPVLLSMGENNFYR